MSESTVCPVCLAPIGPAPTCDCGWELRGPFLLGEPTDTLRAEFADRLAAARHDHDLRAASRVVAELGEDDPGLMPRLRRLLRGGPSTAGASRVDPVNAGPEPPRPRAALASVLGPALARLVAAELDRLVVVEVGAGGVTAHTLETDPAGAPRAVGRTEWPWTELIEHLPSDADLALLRLAGGVGPVPARWPGLSAPRLDQVLAAVPTGLDRRAVLVVLRVAGWPAADLAARDLADRLTTPSTVDSVAPLLVRRADTLAAALRAAPLRHDYALALAELDPPSRRVRLVARTLFGAGAVAGTAEMVGEVRVAAPTRWSGGELQLAVVARPEGDPATWIPVGGGWFPLGSGAEATVRVALDGPGDVRFLGPPGARPAALDWPSLLDGLSGTYGAPPVDLVFAIELGEKRDAGRVDSRLRLVRGLLDLIDSEHPEPNVVRVGLLGYDDHVYDEPKKTHRTVLRPTPWCSTAIARAALSGLGRSERREVWAAPVEDAIAELGGWAWRPDAAHVLVTLGTRPPHPERPVDRTKRCTERHNWGSVMQALVAGHGLRRVAVRDLPDEDFELAGKGATARATEAWRLLGADALQARDAATARTLADASGVLPTEPVGTLRVPLTLGGAR
jgi:hypothetical protein